MVDYSDRLADAMKRRNVSAQQMADHLRVTYQAVKKVLDGKSKEFSAVNHEHAARFLGVSGYWLATGKPDTSQSTHGSALHEPAPEYKVSDPWIEEATAILSSLSAEDRRAAVLSLKTFAALLPKQNPNNGQGVPLAA